MFRTALRNVLAHKARLLMTTLAVLLGVSFVAGTLVFTATVSEAFRKSSEQGLTHVDLAVRQDDGDLASDDRPGAAATLSQELVDEVAALPGVASAEGSVSGPAALADKDDKIVGEGWSTVGSNYEATPAEKYDLVAGRAPEREGEIALDSRTAERTGYAVGDTVRMSVDGPVLEPEITGVFDTRDGNVAAGGVLVLFDTETAQRLFAVPGRFDLITITAAEGVSQQQLKDAVTPLLPEHTEAVTGQQLADDEARLIDEAMSGMRTALLGFAGVSLFVGIFIIANTFTMLVAQRTRELALLRAVGASRRQVTRSVLVEAAAVGLVAGAAGLLAGIGIGAGLRALLAGIGAELPDGPLVITSSAVVVSLAVGLLVTVLAAYLPARRAAKIPPVAAMSSAHMPATTRGLVARNITGALFAAAGTALVLAGVAADSGGGAITGGGAALLVIGVFVLTPLLSRPVIALAAPLLRPFGTAGRLARLNAVRNPRRTAATAAALMIGLTLITGMTVIAGSVEKSIDKMATESLRADYVVSMSTYQPLSPEVARTLAEHPGVQALSGMRNSPARVGDGTEWITGVNGAAIGELTSLPFTAGSFEGLSGNRAVVDADRAEEHGWALGDSIPVVWEDGEAGELTVSGIYEGNLMLRGIMVDAATVDPHLERITDMQVMLRTTDGASAAVKADLERALGNNPAVLVQDKADISRDIASTVTLLLNILYGLLAMAVIVAVLGVINTLAMSVFERRQEIGMLRAIGLDRRGTKQMVRLEAVVIAVFGGVLGIGLGVFFGWAVGEMISGALATYTLVLPWDRMAFFLALAALVGVAAAIWPARRAARLNMLEAIKAQ